MHDSFANLQSTLEAQPFWGGAEATSGDVSPATAVAFAQALTAVVSADSNVHFAYTYLTGVSAAPVHAAYGGFGVATFDPSQVEDYAEVTAVPEASTFGWVGASMLVGCVGTESAIIPKIVQRNCKAGVRILVLS